MRNVAENLRDFGDLCFVKPGEFPGVNRGLARHNEFANRGDFRLDAAVLDEQSGPDEKLLELAVGGLLSRLEGDGVKKPSVRRFNSAKTSPWG